MNSRMSCSIFRSLEQFILPLKGQTSHGFLNIVSGSEANMTTPCEMEFFNFLWLIWDH